MGQALRKDNSTSKISLARDSYPPMLEQYLDFKEKYPGKLVLCQVGDFYEVFFDDAVIVARTLNLTLTSRDKNRPDPIPMCGVPLAVVDGYIDRLVDAGFSVAVVSQAGQVKPGKGMVERRLERIVTPAVRLLGGAHVDSESAHMLAAISVESVDEVAISLMNPQSGVIEVIEQISLIQLSDYLSGLAIKEILIADHALEKKVDRRTGWVREIAERFSEITLLIRHDSFQREAQDFDSGGYIEIEGYAQLSECSRRACRLLIGYIDEVTVESALNIQRITPRDDSLVVRIDAMTCRNLELVKGIKSGGIEGSFFKHINYTLTAGGSRLLRNWILRPLRELEVIQARQASIKVLLESSSELEQIRAELNKISDLERIAARIELRVAQPRELSALRDSFRILPKLIGLLKSLDQKQLFSSSCLSEILNKLVLPNSASLLLEESLVEDPSISLRDGVVIDSDYDQELSRLRELSSSGRNWILNLEKNERANTGISSLKIKFNNVLGYFIEVTRANLGRVPEHYIRRQSMTNVDRFVTEELKQQEEEILKAKDNQFSRQAMLFEEVREKLRTDTVELRALYSVIAELDVLCSFAHQALHSDLVAPELIETDALEYVDGRHLIIENLLEGRFVPNSLSMPAEGQNCFLVTGPNMGGKSTFLRQTGLIVVLAHIGAFVPAATAKVGLVDRIFARLGASDDLLEGQSTFMVEMKEASSILHESSKSSLVLIDEIGRGTATSDGLALAQSILECLLVEVGCRCLFATHYHELTELSEVHARLGNLCVRSVNKQGEVIFTHEIKDGAANRSYGIEVAKKAGLPDGVIKRAQLLLQARPKHPKSSQLSIFDSSSPAKTPIPKCLKEVYSLLQENPVETLRPIDALNIVDRLLKIIERSEQIEELADN